MTKQPQLSILIIVSERFDPPRELYHQYKKALSDTGLTFEVIYVLDGQYPKMFDALETLRSEGEPVKIISLARSFGGATAMKVAFEHSTGELILTLPAFYQVDPAETPKLVKAIEGKDMVLAWRWPRVDSRLSRIQSWIFNGLARTLTTLRPHDIGCEMRLFRRRVIEEIRLYGDQYLFLPIFAHRLGFKVVEVKIAQSKEDRYRRIYPIGFYLRRMLDLLAVFFLARFTKKPFRFFGLLGTGTIAAGMLLTLWLIIERGFFGVPLANRPLLLLGSLAIVLGIQLLAIGLIGELIIFSYAKDVKEYTIDRIIGEVPESQE